MVCYLLAGEGRGNLQTYSFVAIRLFVGLCYFWDPAEHLCFVKHSWLGTIWNDLQTDLILQGGASGWCTILEDVQCYVCA